MSNSIEVTAFFGDYDTYSETHRIGPYPTDAARDRDLIRLERLPGNNGDATFAPTSADPADADHSCTPDQVAGIKHFNQVVGALYGYEVDDNGQDAAATAETRTSRRRPRAHQGQTSLFDLAERAAR